MLFHSFFRCAVGVRLARSPFCRARLSASRTGRIVRHRQQSCAVAKRHATVASSRSATLTMPTSMNQTPSWRIVSTSGSARALASNCRPITTFSAVKSAYELSPTMRDIGSAAPGGSRDVGCGTLSAVGCGGLYSPSVLIVAPQNSQRTPAIRTASSLWYRTAGAHV